MYSHIQTIFLWITLKEPFKTIDDLSIPIRPPFSQKKTHNPCGITPQGSRDEKALKKPPLPEIEAIGTRVKTRTWEGQAKNKSLPNLAGFVWRIIVIYGSKFERSEIPLQMMFFFFCGCIFSKGVRRKSHDGTHPRDGVALPSSIWMVLGHCSFWRSLMAGE